MDFQQSKTYTNMQSAYERELMVSTLYELFSEKATLEEFIDISINFDTISHFEKAHARIFLRLLNNGMIPSTQDNLLTSANFEVTTSELYREYSITARDEGYTDIAALFNGLANIELNHDLIFRTLHEDVVLGEVFCKPGESLWICINCGNIMSGTCAPEICPVCGYPQGYYKIYENVTA